jgi:hypothetical protein
MVSRLVDLLLSNEQLFVEGWMVPLTLGQARRVKHVEIKVEIISHPRRGHILTLLSKM